MSSDRETTRIVRSWLEEGVTALPDRVLDGVLDQVPATRQRRSPWWPARRLPIMNKTMRIALSAAVVAVALLLGFNYFVTPNIGSPGLGDPEPTFTPTPVPTPEPTATPIPRLNGQEDLDAGQYRVGERFQMDITISVPDGWSAFEDFAVDPPAGADPPGGSSLAFWSVENLYVDPLAEELGTLDPPVGPTVDDLVDALVTHPAWTTTAAIDITVDGFAGERLELTIPSGVEFDNCGSSPFLMWTATSGGYRCAQGPGQVHDIYVVDVEGERLVFYVISFPDTPAADLAALQAVVESIEIDPLP